MCIRDRAKAKHTPFVVTVTTAAQASTIDLKLVDSPPQRLSAQEVLAKVKAAQLSTLFGASLRKFSAGQRFSFEVWDSKAQGNVIPRFTLHILDAESPSLLDKKTCAAFIVSRPKRYSYSFGTEKGMTELLAQTGMSRLIVILANPTHRFGTVKEIQAELGPVVADLIPKSCSNKPVPFFSEGGETLGENELIFEDADFIVEDVCLDEEEQEFARYIIRKEDYSTPAGQFALRAEVVDTTAPIADWQKFVLAGLAFCSRFESKEEGKTALVWGGGQIGLAPFLEKVLPSPRLALTVADGNAKAFTLAQLPALRAETRVATDVATVLADAAYDLIIVDVAPPSLRAELSSRLPTLKRALRAGGALFAVFRRLGERKDDFTSTVDEIAKEFNLIYSGRADYFEDVVLYCMDVDGLLEKEVNASTKEEITIVKEKLLPSKKDLETRFRRVKETFASFDETSNLHEYLGEVELAHPRLGKSFQKTNTFLKRADEEEKEERGLQNATKDMYLNDFEKVNKRKKDKKRKNKNK
eukprot:TRINITY_DN6745_c0_g1_i4.p1 TRINITY_DN6745_c0_g1~~TRINITY_DN6745_c0_g1_i4.p1  ORF type:complete len:527 (-),score=155.94 TRINITY_DN6745_c0_g1_i4:45-1625(-)